MAVARHLAWFVSHHAGGSPPPTRGKPARLTLVNAIVPAAGERRESA
jgi:hypothetical protein